MSFSKPAELEEAVVIYETTYCGFCVLAKKLLSSRNIKFARVNVSDEAEARVWLLETSGQRTVPQIFVHGRPIGGYTELAKLERSGELQQMLLNT